MLTVIIIAVSLGRIELNMYMIQHLYHIAGWILYTLNQINVVGLTKPGNNI